ncbi:hypothetical protein BH20ACI3_BH20ACI3_09040 [soil metagenome]
MAYISPINGLGLMWLTRIYKHLSLRDFGSNRKNLTGHRRSHAFAGLHAPAVCFTIHNG